MAGVGRRAPRSKPNSSNWASRSPWSRATSRAGTDWPACWPPYRADTPLTAVFHAAGVPQVSALTDTGAGLFAEVYSGKVAGARNLDELTRSHHLDAFVLYASGAGVWGSAGQGAYAAANAELDALARRRRADGLPATSVAWGVWEGEGMGGGEGAEFLRRRGVRPMAPRTALEHLVRAIDDEEPCLTVTDMDWPRFADGFTAFRPSPLISGLPEAHPAPQLPDGPPESAVTAAPGHHAAAPGRNATAVTRARIEGLGPDDRPAALLALIRDEAADLLGFSGPEEVAADERFLLLGFDSLSMVQLRRRLGAALDVELPATVVLDHGTSRALADHLAGLLAGDRPGDTPAGVTDRAPAGTSTGPGSLVDAARPTARTGFTGLYEEAVRTRRVGEAVDVLAAAASFRPSFGTADEQPLTPVVMSGAEATTAPARPLLVGCAGTSVASGPHEFLALARALEGRCDFAALPQPGFEPGEKLPASLDVLLEAQAAALARLPAGRPFVLLGHSAGANLAHALTCHLEARGDGPAALVLLDVYTPRDPGAIGRVAPRNAGLGGASRGRPARRHTPDRHGRLPPHAPGLVAASHLRTRTAHPGRRAPGRVDGGAGRLAVALGVRPYRRRTARHPLHVDERARTAHRTSGARLARRPEPHGRARSCDRHHRERGGQVSLAPTVTDPAAAGRRLQLTRAAQWFAGAQDDPYALVLRDETAELPPPTRSVYGPEDRSSTANSWTPG
ncbi:KR domain-containing protein [Streptomyces sp. GLT-R25]